MDKRQEQKSKSSLITHTHSKTFIHAFQIDVCLESGSFPDVKSEVGLAFLR